MSNVRNKFQIDNLGHSMVQESNVSSMSLIKMERLIGTQMNWKMLRFILFTSAREIAEKKGGEG